MNKSTDYILAIAVFLIAFLLVFLSRYSRLESPRVILPPEESAVLFLDEGGDLEQLVQELTNAGFVVNENELYWAARIKGWSGYRAGRYEIHGPQSYDSILSKLSRGEQDPFMVSIGGGMDTDRFVLRIANQFRFTSDELLNAMRDSTFLADVNIEPHLLIGRMLPNSYEMYWTTSPEQFLRRMLREFDVAVTNRYERRAQELGLSIDEIVTLASIIEGEVRHVAEKPRVSGLYWNRLNRRMMLQADPTVVYAIGERRRLLFSDYRVDHPYNTYRIRGLPPGPINNPRITSIRAALYPEQHNYIFMVATPEGYHTFTTTYSDHRRESARWTSWLREQRQIREQREREAELEQQRMMEGSGTTQ